MQYTLNGFSGALRAQNKVRSLVSGALLIGALLTAVLIGLTGCPDDGGGNGNGNSAPTAVSEVAAGVQYTCARFNNGEVKCWGNNNAGQLGQGHTNNIGAGGETLAVADAPVINLGSGRTAQQISTGTSHACALLDNNTVKCWGNNGEGQLGQGNTRNIGDGRVTDEIAHLSVADAPPIDFGMSGGTPLMATQISAGNELACASFSNGGVKCWGTGNNGVLGQGDTNNIGDGSGLSVADAPVLDLGSGRTATQVSTGTQHSCVLLNGGEIKCWGQGGAGQLGLGNTDESFTPTANTVNLGMDSDGAPLTAMQVEAGDRFTCAVLNDNSAKCWGFNDNDQLGLSVPAVSNRQKNSPSEAIDFGEGRTATQIDLNTQATLQNNPVACTRLNDGSAKCWGAGFHGQLGQGSIGNVGSNLGFSRHVDASGTQPTMNLSVAEAPPIELGSGRTATQIAAGFQHTCALLDNGGVKCWGRGALGALGQGNTQDRGRGPDQLGDNLAEIDFGF